MHCQATRILRQWGIDFNATGCVAYKLQWARSANSLEELRPPAPIDPEKLFGSPGLTVHRADIHKALRELAISPNGLGFKVELRLSSTIESYDCETATITLSNGASITGDLLVLADGLHSKGAEVINQKPCPVVPSHHTVVRFMVDTDIILSDPATAPVVPTPDSIDAFHGGDRYLVKYPCRNNTLQNFALYIETPPPPPSEATTGDNRAVTRASLLKSMTHTSSGPFAPALLALTDKVSDVLPLWRCFDRPPLTRYVRARCVMIGDAAHPMLPHKGLGFTTGVEDAAALGTSWMGLPSPPSPTAVVRTETQNWRRRSRSGSKCTNTSAPRT